MNTILFLLISFFSMGPMNESEQPVQETTTYYFIRHAEKESGDPSNKDPELSQAGKQRAEKWADVFKDVQFDVILSTNYNRTRSTAATIAASQEKEVEFYDPRNLNDPEFKKKTKGKTVLVVGHSNTNPAFVNLVMKSEKYKALDESEYGSLFIVSVSPTGDKTSQLLYFN